MAKYRASNWCVCVSVCNHKTYRWNIQCLISLMHLGSGAHPNRIRNEYKHRGEKESSNSSNLAQQQANIETNSSQLKNSIDFNEFL